MSGAKKKKPALSPEAAKILEQYRNVGKAPKGGDKDGTGSTAPDAPTTRANTDAAGNHRPVQRSGVRGK